MKKKSPHPPIRTIRSIPTIRTIPLPPIIRIFLHSYILKFAVVLPLFLVVFLWGYSFFIQGVQAIWSPLMGSWKYRQQLNIVNSSGVTLHTSSTIAVTIDTKTLVSQGKLKSDCSDIRVVYQPNDQTNTELTRHLVFPGASNCGSSQATRVYFPLQTDLTSSTTSTNYYLYFGNTQAVAPSNQDAAYNIGAKTALLVCPFDGTTTCSAGETPTTSTGAVRYGAGKSALSFDGSGDYVTFSDISSTFGESALFTAEFWIKPNANSYGSYKAILGSQSTAWNVLYMSTATNVIYRITNSGGGEQTLSWIINDTTDVWSHFALVFNKATSKATLYQNGISKGDVTITSYSSQSLKNIGGQLAASEKTSGLIDEVRISNIARYTSNFTPQTTPFVRDQYTKLLYHFDENGDVPYGTSLTLDDSGNGNNGTITGAKYTSGIVGIDNSTNSNSQIQNQNFASHNGIFIEEGTTNKILNPSFENSTYNTNWTDPGENWWLAGGVSSSNVVAAYQPLGATDYSSSKINIANPGTYNITEATGTPGWTTTEGWKGNGAVLTTGISPDNSCGWTYLARYSNYPWENAVIFAGNEGQLYARGYVSEQGVGHGGFLSIGTGTSGVIGFSAKTAYFNGVAQGTIPAGTMTNSSPLYVLGTHYSFGYAAQTSSYVQAFAVYNTALTSDQVAAVTTGMNNAGLAASVNTDAAYIKFGTKSVKLVSGGTGKYVTSLNPGNTNTHTLSAYIYNGTSGAVGGTVDSSVAKLVFNGSSVTSTYTDVGGGWWRLTYSASTSASEGGYGIEVQAGKTIYLDGVQLEEKAYATSYTDGSLGTGYSWSGTGNNSTSTREVSSMKYQVSSNIQASAGSVSFWVKTPYAGNDSVNHVLLDTDTTSGTLKISKNASNNLVLTDGTNSATIPVSWTANLWNHVVASWGSSSLSLFLNNTAGTNAGSFSAPTLSTSMYLGEDTTNSNLANAMISDMRIYDSILSTTEVADLYYSGLVSHENTYATVTVENFNDTPGINGIVTNKITNPSFENSTFNTNWIQTQSYSLQDEFTDTQTAGNVNNSNTTDGFGISTNTTRATTDGNSILSVAGGNLLVNGTPVDGDYLLYSTITSRNPGQAFIYNIPSATALGNSNQGIGYRQSSSIDVNTHTYQESISLDSRLIKNGSTWTYSGNPSGAPGKSAIIMRNSGAYYFQKIGSNWQLVYPSEVGTFTPTKVGIVMRNESYNYSLDYIRIPTSSFLPTPLAYDTFSTTSTSTETTGPDSQTTPQLTWTNGTKSGGKMSISPSFGTDLFDEGAGTFASGTYGWDPNMADVIANVSNSLEVTHYNNNIYGPYNYLQGVGDLTTDTTPDVWYAAQFDAKVQTGGQVNISCGYQAGQAQVNADMITSTTFTPQYRSFRAGSNRPFIAFYNMNTGQKAYIDNITLKPLSLSSLFSTVSTSDKDIVVSSDVTLSPGTQAGLATNINSASTPTAGLVAYHDGTNLHFDKFTAPTTWTSLINTAVTYSAGAILRVITYHSDANTLKVRVYYNNVLVGSEQTVSDSSIISNTIHGLFSTYSGNTFDNFSLFARGSDGEYSNLPADPTDSLLVTASTAPTTMKSGATSVKLQNTNTLYPFQYVTSITTGSTAPHTLSAYLFDATASNAGGLVNASTAKLVFNGTTVTPSSITSSGAGWYRLAYTGTPTSSSQGLTYGVEVQAGKTVYMDSVQLEEGSSLNEYVDGSLGTGYSWSGGVNNSSSLKTAGAGQGQGPTALYHFDESYGTTANDATLNLNHLTLSGATWIRNQSLTTNHYALSFDGTNDYLSRPFDQDFDFGTGEFSISSFFSHPSTVSGQDTILSRTNSGGTVGYKIYMNSSGYICFQVNSDSVCTTSTQGSYADSKWHHLEAVRGANDLKLYIDGEQKAVTNVSSPSSVDGSNTLFVGIDSDGSSNPWTGTLDDLAIYPTARTQAQVKTDAMGNQLTVRIGSPVSDPLQSGLVGWWSFDESSGSLMDRSGNGNTGTWNGTGASHYTTGKFGNGGGFNGTDDWIDIPDTPVMTEFTVAAWIKTTNLTHQNIVSGYPNPAWAGFYIGTSPTGNAEWFDGVNWRTGSIVVANGTWHHVVYIFNKGSMEIAVDGKKDLVNSSNSQYASGAINIIGAMDGVKQRFFNGSMDDVRIYNRALTVSEVEGLYKYAPGPLAHYTFDDSTSSSQVQDSSGNGYTGTWNGTGSHYTQGKVGKAGNFNGTNDYVAAGSFTTLTQWTASMWIKPNIVSPSYQELLGGPTNAYGGLYLHGNKFQVYQSADYDSINTVPVNAWTYVTAVVDSDSLDLYINGVFDKTYAVSPSFGGIPKIGVNAFTGNTEWYSGVVDDIRIYNYARTREQITEDMLAGGSPVSGGGGVSSITGSGKQSGPVAYYKFDEGTGTIANNSGNGGSALNGTLTNMSSPATATSGWTNNGKYGKALNFDGYNDGAYVNSPQGLPTGSSERTFSIWFKLNTLSSQHELLALGDNSSQRFAIFIDNVSACGSNHSSIGVEIMNYGKVYNWTPDMNWHYVAAVLPTGATNVNQTLIYLDGNLMTSTLCLNSSRTINTPNNQLRISGLPIDNGNYVFSGVLDEVKIYNFALSSDQVKQDYNKGASLKLGSSGTNASNVPSDSSNDSYCPPGQGTTCVGPVAEWNMDEGQGQYIEDTTGNNNRGTLGAESSAPTWTTGKMGKALSFDGNDDYVTITSPHSSTDISRNFTLSAYIKKNSNSNQGIISHGSNGYYLRIRSDGKLQLLKSQTEEILTGTTSLANNTWYYVTVTVSSASTATVTMYVNSVSDGTTTTTTTFSNSSSIQIGSDLTTTERFAGSIDDVKIYNYARTPSQIAWDYNRGKPVAWYKFDEESGTTAYDASGNGNNSTVTGATITTQGKLNNALSFDGTDDYVGIGSTASVNSISFWMKQSNTSDKSIIDLGGGYTITLAGNTITTSGFSSPTVYIDGTASSVLSNTSWHLVTVTTTTAFNLSNPTIGKVSSNYYTGLLDDLRLYNYPLTSTQVKDLYNGGAVKFGR